MSKINKYYKVIKLKFSIILVIIIILQSACKTDLEDELIGVWVIDEMQYSKENLKNYLMANAITIRKDHTCDLPIINVNDNHSEKQKGVWGLKQQGTRSFIIIKTKNELFNNSFTIEKTWREIDSESRGEFIKIILSTDSIRIKCKRDASDVQF